MKVANKIIRIILLMLSDAFAVVASSVIALYAENLLGSFVGNQYYYVSLLLSIFAIFSAFTLLQLYSFSSTYVGILESLKLALATLAITALHYVEIRYLLHLDGLIHLGYFLIFFMLMVVFTFIPRYARRAVVALRCHMSNAQNSSRVPVMIVGAGAAGASLLREINASDKINYAVKCFVDDDILKKGTSINGVKVKGGRERIPELVKKYGICEIYIAMPSCSGDVIEEITAICRQTPCKIKTLPGIYQLVNGEVSVKSLRDVSIDDLLSRKSVSIDLDKIMDYVTGKVIMITGGGGSIGSELCRQIASHNPARLIIVDIYENNAYDIQQELLKKFPSLDLVTLIASVRDYKRMERIFKTYRPQIVFHAAAHKHVPLMETSPNEAIKNNVFGTLTLATLADKFDVKRFVMISTDKAVNPTNVMGATKRICEMIIQSFNKRSETEFVAVRFGNVLGSNGSVVPLFKKQIAEGGPVYVTHPEIIRYFMTIPEAVALVIQAGAYAKGGEIFVLDMGKPVKILDLAENLIRLSGLEPYKDIDIKFTGLRPGEKLYEEMLMNEELLKETENKLIHIGKPIDFDDNIFLAQLDELRQALDSEPTNARKLISKIVPTYIGNSDLENV